MTVPRTLRALAFAAVLGGALALPWAGGGRAADALRYAVSIAPSGVAKLDGAVPDASDLVRLRDAGGAEGFPLGGAALMARAKADAGRFAAMMGSLGYYDGVATVRIAGRTLDDPALPGVLDAWPEEQPVPVAVGFETGPQFSVRRIVVQGDAAGEGIDLHPGDPAVAADVLAAAAKLRARLLDGGHALAKVGEPEASLDRAAQAIDVTIAVAAGPRVDIGAVSISGLDHLDEDFVRRRLGLQPGTPFDPAVLEADRARLARVPAVASVRITPGDALDGDGRLPIGVTVAERKRHIVTFSAGYATDLGGEVEATWTNRNLWGGGETLAASAGVTNLGGTDSVQPGYRVVAQLTVPDFPRALPFGHDPVLGVNAQAVKEYLDAYDRTAVVLGTSLTVGFGKSFSGIGGLTVERSYIVQNGVGRNYALVQTPLTARLDTTDNLLEPTRGVRASAILTPTYSYSSPSASFLIAQAQASTYFDLAAPGRTILALRGLVGATHGATTFEIPPDQRFYAGGTGTVRGYKYQSVGPQFANGNPTGGTAIAAATLELRQRIGESWGAAAFVDVGGVGTNGIPLSGQLRTGVGLGARYYTGFGALRLDAALPLQRPRGGDIGEIYIGLGEAF